MSVNVNNYKKVWSVVVVCVILKLELCESNAIKSKSAGSNDAERTNTRQFQNVSIFSEEKEFNETTEMTTEVQKSSEISDIKIADQKYSQNTSGEYKHEVLFSNGDWRAEQGEYEDHNGAKVFVIRGVFSYHTREGTYNTTLYIVDEFGYHNVQPPPQLTEEEGGSVDYRPDVQTTSECNNEKGSYCIDPKLLALLVVLASIESISVIVHFNEFTSLEPVYEVSLQSLRQNRYFPNKTPIYAPAARNIN